jgi:mono/diheme cytochrome c family protein
MQQIILCCCRNVDSDQYANIAFMPNSQHCVITRLSSSELIFAPAIPKEHFPTMKIHTIIITSISAIVLSACSQATTEHRNAVKRGKVIYSKECSQCHGGSGEGAGKASLGLGVPPPDLTALMGRNDGEFPREFVRRFVMGLLEKDDPDAAMPEFKTVGLRHVYPNGGADGEVLERDFEDLLDYLEEIQK